jgi:hypothetical protein
MASTVTTHTDEDIQREVLRELKWDSEVASNEIGADVRNGVATLIGWVDTFSKKWAAERAALRVRGLKAVVNNIEVRLSPSDEQTDVCPRGSEIAVVAQPSASFSISSSVTVRWTAPSCARSISSAAAYAADLRKPLRSTLRKPRR